MARTQAFDWLSTLLLAALILIVPILFVIWVNPGLLDRLQEEIAGNPTPVGPADAPIAPSTDEEGTPGSGSDADGAGEKPAPSQDSPEDEGYISTPDASGRQNVAALVEVEGNELNENDDAGDARTAAKPVADAAANADDPSAVFAASPGAEESDDGAAVQEGEPSSAPTGPPIDPANGAASGEKTSTEPGGLAVPPAIAPTAPVDPDNDGDQGGLKPLDASPVTGVPTPAAAPADTSASGMVPAPGPATGTKEEEASAEDASAVGAATASDAAGRHEELLREIRALATSQRALEEQFSALRKDIDGRFSVLKSAVEDAAVNGAAPVGSAKEPDAESLPSAASTAPGSSPASGSAAEQARAARATKILRAMLDGKLTLELGDDDSGGGGPATIEFLYVPPGRFRFGRTESEQQAAVAGSVGAPAQEILIDRGFFVSKHEISDEQFAAFLRANYADDPKLDAILQARNDLDRPAAKVTWPMAKFFCLWASNESKFDLRLPTEIEWEYAARGPYGALRPEESGETSAGPVESSARDVGDDPADRSWCGAVDMWGNVAEWCADLYAADAFAVDAGASGDATSAKVYSPAPAPEDWLSTGDGGRSVRGGSFADPVDSRDFSERRQAKPDSSAATLGFRVVLIPDFDGEAEVGRLP